MKINTFSAVLVASLFLTACNGKIVTNGAGGSISQPLTAPIQGADLSGTYQMTGVTCIAQDGSQTTAVATVGQNDVVETLIINGNSLIQQDTTTDANGQCSAVTTQKAVWNTATHEVAFSGTKVTILTSQSQCTASLHWQMVSGTGLTQMTLSGTLSPGSQSDMTANFLSGGTSIGILTTIHSTDHADDSCWLVYTRKSS